MKKFSIILVIALIFLMCLSACSTSANNTDDKTDTAEAEPQVSEKVQESQQPTAQLDTTYTVETVGEKDENANGQVIGDCHYQKVVFTNPNAALTEINNEIAEECDDFFNEGLGKQYEEYFSALPDSMKSELADQPFAATLDVKDVYIDDNYVSITLNWDWFVGGVHNSGSDGLNFDLKTGEDIDFEDLFASEAEARDAFSNAVSALIDADPDSFFEDAKDTVKNYDLSDISFTISADNLTVFIEPYAIAPGASGSFTVDIAR